MPKKKKSKPRKITSSDSIDPNAGQPTTSTSVKKSDARNAKMEHQARVANKQTDKKSPPHQSFGIIPVGATNLPMQALAEYKREDQTTLLVSGKHFGKDSAKSRSSSAYYWILPGQTFQIQEHRGNLLKLQLTTVSVHNTSPVDLTIFAARPYGFESDPLAYSNWESVWRQGAIVLKSGKQRRFRIRHHANNFVVPKQEYVSGKSCIHLFSMTTSYNDYAKSGVNINLDNVAESLKVDIKTKYISDGSLTGTIKSYAVRHYDSDNHMHIFNQPPPVSMSVNQLRLPISQANQIEWEEQTYKAAKTGSNANKSIAFYRAKFLGMDKPDGHAEFSYVTDSLDQRLIYQISAPSLCISANLCGDASEGVTLAGYIVHIDKGSSIPGDGKEDGMDSQTCKEEGWYLTVSSDPATSNTFISLARFYDGSSKGPYEKYKICAPVNCAGATTVTPVIRNSKSPSLCITDVTRRMDAGGKLLRNESVYNYRHKQKDLTLDSWADVLLSSITLVVGLAKAVVEVAAIFGITEMNNDLEDEDCDYDVVSVGSQMG